MRKFIYMIAALTLSIAPAKGATVTTTPGGLSQVATNTAETSLTVTGAIDARDFRYIVDHLTALQTLDLQGATIAALESEDHVFGNERLYAANTVPTMALAGHQRLQSVKLPSTATAVAPGAFAACPVLTTIELPATLTEIGDHAFAGCQALTTMTLPAALTRLGDGAFIHCHALATIGTADGNGGTLAVGNEAFLDCPALTTVTLSNKTVSIGARAFAGTGLQALDLSAYTQLRTVGDFAFVNSQQLTSIKFPSSVTRIGSGALLYANATSIVMPKELQVIEPFAFAGAKLAAVDMGKVTSLDTIGDYAFYAVTRPTTFTLPGTTAYIGTHAMDKMTGLTSIRTTAKQVPALGADVWQQLNQSAIKLYVPDDVIDDYKAAEQWKEFDVLPGYLRGDANNDGTVDIGDVNAIINRMLNKPSDEEFVFEAADTDSNGTIDIDDVNYVINVILRRVTHAPQQTPDTDDLLSIDDFAVEAGQTVTVPVRLSNMGLYTAVQCDITLPEGLTLASDGISATESSAGHIIASATDEGTVRIVCYSLQGNTLGNGEAVVELTLEATDALRPEATIGIEHGVLATASSAVRHCEPSYAHVSSTTAVDDLASATNHWRAWGDQGGTLVVESDTATQAQLIAINGTATTLAVMAGRNHYDGLQAGVYVVRIGTESIKVIVR